MVGLLDDGDIWERSFILPEHKEAMKVQDRENKRKAKPILDVQELEQIHQAISESLHEHRRITLRLYGEYEDTEMRGIVTAIQTHCREIKLATTPGEWQWIRMSDILFAE
ncbi:YolD-like family protein [Paenibacillus motobuensis]|uniref:YolD-like family protein n=1 Tax=Paenibacillus TaxID=44249 RepID=UPI00203A70F1|nr:MULTISPECIES: YolD-like family protein [Paenibacillus]MCM3042802.1 YolD-like family protein [Paenibacillus lutimineralis]MCM3649906.1 YolD-like family protein [Paenibacillus motobuensis]